jgi:hypothetical protein
MALSVAHGIPEEFRREFTNNLEHEIQQLNSKFSSRIKVEGFEGKENVYNSLEPREFKTRSGRLQQSAPTEAEIHARKLVKVPFYDQAIFDKWDKEFLGKLALPDSETIEAMKAAYARLVDTQVCIAADATVYGGEEPYVTAIDLPSSQKVAVNYVNTGSPANSGLTPWKILKAIQIFEENDLDPNEREICIAINPKGKQDLIAYVASGTNDVWANMIKSWLEGKAEKLMGLTPVMTNRLVNNSSTDVDTAFVWDAKTGIYMAPEKLEVMMDILPTQQHALQISAYATLGFMRRFEKGVVTIACDRTP